MTTTPVLTSLSLEQASKPIVVIPQPVGEKERIISIDVLRGFALLGILPMNISVFLDDQRRVFESHRVRKSDRRELLGVAAVSRPRR